MEDVGVLKSIGYWSFRVRHAQGPAIGEKSGLALSVLYMISYHMIQVYTIAILYTWLNLRNQSTDALFWAVHYYTTSRPSVVQCEVGAYREIIERISGESREMMPPSRPGWIDNFRGRISCWMRTYINYHFFLCFCECRYTDLGIGSLRADGYRQFH